MSAYESAIETTGSRPFRTFPYPMPPLLSGLGSAASRTSTT